MYDLIIIGAGPAGLSAGIYAARKQIKTLILTKDLVGQVGRAGIIENWPGEKNISGPELINKFRDHLILYNLNIQETQVESVKKNNNIFLVKTEKQEFETKSIIIATGRVPRSLNIPGEKEFIGKGVSFCVTCDGTFFKNKSVVVVGGGNAGFEGAIELANYAKQVFLFEKSFEFKADQILQKKAKEKGIILLNNTELLEIKGDMFVREIEYFSKEKKNLKIEGVFIEIGSEPVVDFLHNSLVDLNKEKEIRINPKTCETKTLGLFAAGDVTDIKDKQIIIASAEGVKALLSVYNYLQNFNT
ncbi:MAG: FAD-dependent oxidoreductase [Candidatus Pacebacteria bacterium]|nr:FAD-dependent oxidoreductase [Candidatus Paceibacterota bacterium]